MSAVLTGFNEAPEFALNAKANSPKLKRNFWGAGKVTVLMGGSLFPKIVQGVRALLVNRPVITSIATSLQKSAPMS